MAKQPRLWLVNGVLLVALAGAWWGRRSESAILAPKDFLKPVPVAYRDWKYRDEPMSADEQEMLVPDAYVVRRFRSPDGKEAAELAVVAGHQKRTVHTPGFCMSGGGWEVVAQREQQLPLGERTVPATRALMVKDGKRLLTTYFFTDGDFSTTSLIKLQGVQLFNRVRGELPMGALVRILVPVNRDGPAAERLSDDLARATVPGVMGKLREVRGKS